MRWNPKARGDRFGLVRTAVSAHHGHPVLGRATHGCPGYHRTMDDKRKRSVRLHGFDRTFFHATSISLADMKLDLIDRISKRSVLANPDLRKRESVGNGMALDTDAAKGVRRVVCRVLAPYRRGHGLIAGQGQIQRIESARQITRPIGLSAATSQQQDHRPQCYSESMLALIHDLIHSYDQGKPTARLSPPANHLPPGKCTLIRDSSGTTQPALFGAFHCSHGRCLDAPGAIRYR
jgi:hypothetical protein